MTSYIKMEGRWVWARDYVRLRWSREFDRAQDCDLTQGRLQRFIGGQLNV